MEGKKLRVLIVTYYWPPAGGPGVQRWLKFVKYLPDFDVEPIVYIPENPSYPITDTSLAEEIRNDVTVLKHKITEPYAWASLFSKKDTRKISGGIIPDKKKQSLPQKLMLWVRGNLFIPDARVLWVKPSVKYLGQYIAQNPVDVVITTGPPHSLHLIGLGLKEKHGVKWVADFRDPWTTIGYHKALKLSERAAVKHEALEKKVLNAAHHIIVTSPTTKKEFCQLTNVPVSVITNGYDVVQVGKQTVDSSFSIAHIGSLLSERNPMALWQALTELLEELPGFKNHLQIKLIGVVSQSVLDSIYSFGLKPYVNNVGYVPHNEALVQQRKSRLLLLIEIDSADTRCIIPGKLFEYMVSGRPILAIGPKDADIAHILKETNTGTFATYADKEVIKQAVATAFKQFSTGADETHPIGLQQYSRKKLTETLAGLLRNITT